MVNVSKRCACPRKGILIWMRKDECDRKVTKWTVHKTGKANTGRQMVNVSKVCVA